MHADTCVVLASTFTSFIPQRRLIQIQPAAAATAAAIIAAAAVNAVTATITTNAAICSGRHGAGDAAEGRVPYASSAAVPVCSLVLVAPSSFCRRRARRTRTHVYSAGPIV